MEADDFVRMIKSKLQRLKWRIIRMIKSMNSGVAGLKAHQSRMDVIGNNIANVNTVAYKTMDATFKESLYSTLVAPSGGSTSNGGLGAINPSLVGYGSVVSAISANFTGGTQLYTGKGLDAMIDGVAFFAVGPIYDAAGGAMSPDDLLLTRNGEFTIKNGYLVDANGNYVYGHNVDGGVTAESSVTETTDATTGVVTKEYGGPDVVGYTFDETTGSYTLGTAVSTLAPIKIPTEWSDGTNEKTMNITSTSLGADGKIYGVDEISGKTFLLGVVSLVTVPNANGLTKEQGPYYSTTDASGDTTIIQTGNAAGKLVAGHLESSNVDIANEFSNMIITQRGFQANTRIITVSDEMLQELVNIKR